MMGNYGFTVVGSFYFRLKKLTITHEKKISSMNHYYPHLIITLSYHAKFNYVVKTITSTFLSSSYFFIELQRQIDETCIIDKYLLARCMYA